MAGKGWGYRLAIANALWGQQGYSMLQDYREVVGHHYGARIHDLDFRGDPERARRVINAWVRGQTDNRIPDLLADGTIDERVRLVLTNAVAFEARWETEFEALETEHRPFYLRDGSRVETPTMRGSIDVGYSARDGYQVIDVPYKGGAAAMTVLLPDEGRFDWFERRLDAGVAAEAITDLEERTLDLFMPRFQFESSFDLKGHLSAMGMPEAFDPERADFSGINGIACPSQACRYVSVAAHRALVENNEEGTKAVAATGLITKEVSGEPSWPRVSIDRPFIFLIRDIPSDTILFVGRVLDPRI